MRGEKVVGQVKPSIDRGVAIGDTREGGAALINCESCVSEHRVVNVCILDIEKRVLQESVEK